MLRIANPGFTRAQCRRLRRVCREAAIHVPCYRRAWSRLGLADADFGDPGVFARLPVLTKAELLGIPPRERVSERYDLARLAVETTTGSTGQPFSLHMDDAYRRRRNLRFLRALLDVGYRPWQRLMLLTDRHGQDRRKGRLHYVSVEQPTAAIASAYRAIRPQVLYGFATPLRLLAERLLNDGPAGFRPRLVISTAEMLDPATESCLEAAFGCPVADFYGMTETGLVAWKKPGQKGYSTPRNAVLTEFVPVDACPGRYKVLMTNLDLLASPIVRFDSGDLAVVEEVGGSAVVTAFEGRSLDTLLCADGSELSPYRITDALRGIAGLQRFRVVQRRLSRLAVEIEAEPAARERIARQVTDILSRLMGGEPGVEFSWPERIVPEGARKFRPVSSEVARP